MTANHDQSASCKILIGGKRRKKNQNQSQKIRRRPTRSAAVTHKRFDVRTTPLALTHPRKLSAVAFVAWRLTVGASADTLIATKRRRETDAD
jgi:hypothetical protein